MQASTTRLEISQAEWITGRAGLAVVIRKGAYRGEEGRESEERSEGELEDHAEGCIRSKVCCFVDAMAPEVEGAILGTSGVRMAFYT